MREQENLSTASLLKQAVRLVDKHIDVLLKNRGVARSQYRVMYYVNKYKEPSQKDLLKALSIQASTLTLMIDALIQKGWLVKVQDKLDRRLNRVSLTPEGKKQFDLIPDPTKALESVILNEIKDANQLKQQLKQIIKTLS